MDAKPFTLDTVLDYRQRLENLAQNALAKAEDARVQVENQISEESAAYSQLVEKLERVQQEGVDIHELVALEEHLTFQKERIAELKGELEKKNQRVNQTRQQLLKKSRERQIMDKLKCRQNEVWRHHLEKKEAASLDEIAILFHNK